MLHATAFEDTTGGSCLLIYMWNIVMLKMLQGDPGSRSRSNIVLCCYASCYCIWRCYRGILALDLEVIKSNGAMLHATAFEDATKGPGSRSWDRLAEAIPYGIGLFYSLPSSHTLWNKLSQYPMASLHPLSIPYETNSAYTLWHSLHTLWNEVAQTLQ